MSTTAQFGFGRRRTSKSFIEQNVWLGIFNRKLQDAFIKGYLSDKECGYSADENVECRTIFFRYMRLLYWTRFGLLLIKIDDVVMTIIFLLFTSKSIGRGFVLTIEENWMWKCYYFCTFGFED